MSKAKNLLKNYFLLASWRSLTKIARSGSDPLVRGTDSRIRIRIYTNMLRIRNIVLIEIESFVKKSHTFLRKRNFTFFTASRPITFTSSPMFVGRLLRNLELKRTTLWKQSRRYPYQELWKRLLSIFFCKIKDSVFLQNSFTHLEDLSLHALDLISPYDIRFIGNHMAKRSSIFFNCADAVFSVWHSTLICVWGSGNGYGFSRVRILTQGSESASTVELADSGWIRNVNRSDWQVVQFVFDCINTVPVLV
jgi:hypothetical protein